MKKTLLAAAAIAVLGLASCSSISHTSTTEAVNTEILNRSTAELEVSPKKITYTFTTTPPHRRAGGEKALKAAAVAKALEQNGNADVLVAPQYTVVKSKGLGPWKIKSVTVTGYPAFYKNVHQTTQAEADVVNTLRGACPTKCKK